MPVPDEQTSNSFIERDITVDGDSFTARFTSPHNTIHQVSGFKSEDEAQAWMAEAQNMSDRVHKNRDPGQKS